jgi:hypothetical protein
MEGGVCFRTRWQAEGRLVRGQQVAVEKVSKSE